MFSGVVDEVTQQVLTDYLNTRFSKLLSFRVYTTKMTTVSIWFMGRGNDEKGLPRLEETLHRGRWLTGQERSVWTD